MRRPDPKTATDEDLEAFILEQDDGGLTGAADTLSVLRLLLAKGIVTYEEVLVEKQRATAVLVGTHVKMMRRVAADPFGDVETEVALAALVAVDEYLCNGSDLDVDVEEIRARFEEIRKYREGSS